MTLNRASWRFLFLGLLLISGAAVGTSNHHTDWRLLKTYKIGLGESLTLSATYPCSDFEIKVSIDGAKQSSFVQNGVEKFGQREFIFVMPEQEDSVVSIFFRTQSHAACESPPSLVHENIGTDKNQILILSRLSSYQRLDHTDEEIVKTTSNKIQDIEQLLIQELKSARFPKWLFREYVGLATLSEDFHRIRWINNLIESKFDEFGSKQRFLINIELLWSKARMLDLQQDFVKSEELYRQLLAKLNLRKAISKRWSLIEAFAEARLGAILVQRSFQEQSELGMREGKEFILSALRTATFHQRMDLEAIFEDMLALYYASVEDYSSAEKLMLSAISKHELVGENRRKGDALNNISVLYRRLGLIEPALDTLNEALLIANEFPNHSERGYVLVNLSRNYYDVGKYYLASVNAERARELFSKSGTYYGAALAALHYGLAQHALENYSEALHSFNIGLAYFSDSDIHRNRFRSQILKFRTSLARTHIKMGNMTAAQSALEGVPLPSQMKGFREVVVDTMLVRLEVEALLGNKNKFDSLAIELEKIFKSNRFKHAEQVYRLEYERLNLLHALQSADFDSAKIIADRSMELIRNVHRKIDSRFLGPAWSNKASQVTELYVQYLVRSGYADDDRGLARRAFKAIEESHGNSFRRSRKSIQPEQNSTISHALDLLRNSEQKLITSSDDNDYYYNNAQTAQLIQGVFSERENQEDFEVISLEIAAVQRRLINGEMVLRYFIRDGVSIVFVITRDGWWLRDLESADQIKESVDSIVTQIQRQASIKGFKNIDLLQMLGIGALELEGVKKIIFVPDGALHHFPLSVVHMGYDSESAYKPLTNDIEIVRTPSVSEYFSEVEAVQSSDGFDFTIFADPNFKNTRDDFGGNELKTESSNTRDLNFPQLTWSGRELVSIIETVKEASTQTFTGGNATAEALLSPSLRASKIIHVATHGYLNSKNPNLAGLVTAPSLNSNEEFGFVSLSQLLTKSFYSNLLVLSGCETYVGKNYRGEGPYSLSWGILARGSGSVISTIWPISDRATASFMATFYENLLMSNGNSSLALRLTKTQMSQSGRFKHPHFWAGFVLTSANREYDENAFR